jgi:phage terminase large subunit-like protein
LPRPATPLALQKWQVDYIATLFGWKRPDGSRRYTESLAALPRKNGKSTLAAGIILYGLVADGRTAGQFYTAAETRDQASLIYRMAARMVRQSPLLAKRLKPIDSTRTITYQSRGSFLRSIPSEAGPVHGTKPATVIFDELHTQKTRDLYDALRTGQGATPNPLFISITTAGHDRHSICFDLWNTARQVRDGTNPNPYFLPLIYELKDTSTNGPSKTCAGCRSNRGARAMRTTRPRRRAVLVRPGPLDHYRPVRLRNGVPARGRRLLPARQVLGTARASTTAGQRDRVPYLEWAQQGFLKLTPGDVVDYDVIRADINALNERYSIQDIAIDRWNAAQITTQLQGDGFNVTAFGQGYASMSPAAKEFEKLVIQGALQHGGNPLLEWMAANVAIEQDAAGNIKPSKAKSTERIDGIVAAVMAVGRAATAQPQSDWWNPSDGVLL